MRAAKRVLYITERPPVELVPALRVLIRMAEFVSQKFEYPTVMKKDITISGI